MPWLYIRKGGNEMQEKAVYHICVVSEKIFHLLRGAVGYLCAGAEAGYI